MSSYISSNNNRFYAATEATYGTAQAAQASNRIPAVKLTTTNSTEKIKRRDKTGTRTFTGSPSGLRTTTTYQLSTYLAAWTDQTEAPPHGALLQAALGSTGLAWSGAAIASVSGTRMAFGSAHGLSPGQAISTGTDIRFVAAVVDAETVVLNAPLSTASSTLPSATPTFSYQPASEVGSVSIWDYWTPTTSVQRLLTGAAVNEFSTTVNGDLHQFQFSGPAADLVDTASFLSGEAGLSAYPVEPSNPAGYTLIPGHLGQAWLGTAPTEFFTLTSAQFVFNNGLTLRDNEFGSTLARGISPGQRTVTIDFTVYAQDDAGTQALYQAARQRSPLQVMLQLGQQQGELFGIYLSSVVPEVPQFDDTEVRQQWTFKKCRAQGTLNNEVFLAFA